MMPPGPIRRATRRARLMPGQMSLRRQIGAATMLLVSAMVLLMLGFTLHALRHVPDGSVAIAVAIQGMLILLLGLAAARGLAALLALSVERLSNEADQLGSGPDDGRMARVRGSLEAQRLSRSLRSMARRLDGLERQLADADERASQTSDNFTQQIEKLRRLADTDPLTSLLNRRGFFNAAQAMPVATDPVGVLLIDIDHFKRVNDLFGHPMGDEVIRVVANAIQATVRQNDLVGRLGGEEFVVMVPGTAEALEALADRIRLAAEQGTAADDSPAAVTVSIGVAVSDGGKDGVQDLIDRADAALYQAKQSGRNCIRMHR